MTQSLNSEVNSVAKRKHAAEAETPAVIEVAPQVPEPAPAAPLRASEYGEKAALIRQLLQDHPEKSNGEINALFREEAQRRGADLGDASSMISVYRSQMNGSGPSGQSSKRPRNRKPQSDANSPSLSQLRAVKTAIDAAGGLPSLLEEVERVTALIESAGGHEAFRECVDFWRETLG